MKIIFRIAKNELRYLFYSPIAWFLLIVCFVLCAGSYSNFVYEMANQWDIQMKNNPGFKSPQGSITFKVFASGIITNTMQSLYLFIPLLTMGLINRENNTGSVRLLYTSPVTLRQIVLGKYLGIMMFNLLLVLILCVFMITAAFNIKHVDYGLLWSAPLGFYLLVGVFSAAGLFMSSLSNYQIVSALSTFVVIFILNNIGGLWQKYDFIRDITFFLSLQNRTIKIIGGLIVSRDVIYFVLIACMFICFTLIKLRATRESRPWYITSARYLIVIIVVTLIGYISSRPALTGYWDTTATKRNTIPKEMQQIIKDIGDSTLEVTLYTNLVGDGLGYGLPENRNASYLSSFWDPYLRFKPDIKFKYEYYYDTDAEATDSALYKSFPGKKLEQIAAEIAESIDENMSRYKSPEEMHKLIDLRPEGYKVVMQLKCRGKTEYLRTFGDEIFWPQLTEVSAAFKRLLQPKTLKVYFVTGNLERNIYKFGEREYAFHTAFKGARSALVNIGFNVDTINLETQDIPTDNDVLVLADPKIDLNPAILSKLKNYINTGGNMVIMGEPGKQYVLNPLLSQLGVQLMYGQLLQPSFNETPDKVISNVTGEGLTAGMEGGVLMTGVSALTYNTDSVFTVKPLLKTIPGRVWLKAGSVVIDSTLPDFNVLEGDIKINSFSTAVQLTRNINKKEQRIVICGDADFASNIGLGHDDAISFYSWATYDQFPIRMSQIDSKDNMLNIGANAARIQKIIYTWIIPGLMLLTGIILLIRRKRK